MAMTALRGNDNTALCMGNSVQKNFPKFQNKSTKKLATHDYNCLSLDFTGEQSLWWKLIGEVEKQEYKKSKTENRESKHWGSLKPNANSKEEEDWETEQKAVAQISACNKAA